MMYFNLSTENKGLIIIVIIIMIIIIIVIIIIIITKKLQKVLVNIYSSG